MEDDCTSVSYFPDEREEEREDSKTLVHAKELICHYQRSKDKWNAITFRVSLSAKVTAIFSSAACQSRIDEK